MFWISTAARRSLGKAAPDGSLNAFPSAVMIFAVFTEEPLADMGSESGRRQFQIYQTSPAQPGPGAGIEKREERNKRSNVTVLYCTPELQLLP